MISLTAPRLFFIAFIFLISAIFLFYLSTYINKKNVDASTFLIDISATSDRITPLDIIPDIASTSNNTIVNKTPSLGNEEINIGKPVSFSIPSIHVSANVEHIGLTSNGAVGAPEGAYEVSWFNKGPKPGEKGNALISGHSGIWKDGTHSIFDSLHTLKIGDTIYVTDDNGIKRSFIVKEMRVYNKDETVPELFNTSDSARLNIITCHGDWIGSEKTYSKRLVVFTQM